MNKNEVIEKIGQDRWKEFCEFMTGQTVGVTKNGYPDYYEHDVERFIEGREVID